MLALQSWSSLDLEYIRLLYFLWPMSHLFIGRPFWGCSSFYYLCESNLHQNTWKFLTILVSKITESRLITHQFWNWLKFEYYRRIVAWPFPFSAGLLMSATFSPAIVSSSSWLTRPLDEAVEVAPMKLLLNWAGGAGIAVMVSIGKSWISEVALVFDDRKVEAVLPLLTVAVLDRLDEGLFKRSISGLGTWM